MKNTDKSCLPNMLAALVLTLSWFGFSGEAQAQAKFAACKPVQTAVFSGRIHVRCEYPVDNKFLYFAAPTSEPKFANRALSVILSAQLSGKVVTVLFDPLDESGDRFGCAKTDCRNFSAILLEEGPPPPPPQVPQPRPPVPTRQQCLDACTESFEDCKEPKMVNGRTITTPLTECVSRRNTCESSCPRR